MESWSNSGARKVPDIREIPVPPDDLDQMTAVRTEAATTPRPVTAPTIASAPAGDRAQWLRELLEYSAACEDPVEQQRCRRSIVTEYLPVARSLASRYSGL